MNNKIKQAPKLTLIIGLGIVFSGNALAGKTPTPPAPTYATTQELAAAITDVNGNPIAKSGIAVASEANVRYSADTDLLTKINAIPALPVGIATGAMQWWNGSTWVTIPVGANNTTLKNCEGIPTWVADHCAFQIGDRGPAGGWVFYITDAGQHGLEAAPVDQAAAPWGCYGTVVGGTSSDIGTGLANTTAINAKCGFGTAAYNAANYSSNGLGGWYLPSKDELNQMYLNIGQGAPNTNVGGFASSFYWSSTENPGHGAWYQNFLNGYQPTFTSNSPTNLVRPVRAF